MSFVILAVYVFLLLFIIYIVRDKISKLIILIYVSFWCGSLLLCHINPFQYYEVSDSSYFILLGHVVAFVFGFIMPKIRKRDIGVVNKIPIDISTLFKSKFFLIIYILNTLFVLNLLIKQRQLLAIYSLSDVRGDFMDLVMDNSGGVYLIHNIISTSLFHFALCLNTYMLFFERKWKYIIMLSAYIILFAMIGGGRNGFMTIGYYCFSFWLLSDYIQSVNVGRNVLFRFPTKIKILLGIVAVIAVVAMTAMTAMRRGHMDLDNEAFNEGFAELGEKFGEYSVGPIVAFDIAMQDKSFHKEKYFGRATFTGTDYFLYIFFRKLGISFQPSNNTTVSVLQNDIINIGSDRRWNYAYTCCMYYFYDFGIVGVIVMPLLLGFLVRRFILRLYKTTTIYEIAIFTFICFCIYMSVFSGYTHKMMFPFYIITMSCLSNYKYRKQWISPQKIKI